MFRAFSSPIKLPLYHILPMLQFLLVITYSFYTAAFCYKSRLSVLGRPYCIQHTLDLDTDHQ